ncbi:MAG: sigma-70 family RNA polymerase sigma factor [Parafilimonas sp.]|nr:sigma-70 family RNA polymerase sigma factor [Parafilimonas sp.]
MIEAIKNGDVNAFEAAYIQYRGKLYAYFLKKTIAEEDAKDLLQITFSKLWQYRHSLSVDYLLEQHLFHIARTVFIDYLRKENKLQKVRTTAKLHSSEKLSEEYMSEFDLRTRLQTILSEMPLLRKRIFELHKLEGYSYKEIAEILSISVKSVDNNLAKALKYLRSSELLVLMLLLNFFH